MIGKKEAMVYEKKIKRLITDIKETADGENKRLFFLQGQASFIHQHMVYNSMNPRLIDMSIMALEAICERTDSLSDEDFVTEVEDDNNINENDEDKDDIISQLNSFDLEKIQAIITDLGIKTESIDKRYLIKLIKKEYNENS